jgi:hypothetical protein
MPRRIPLAEGQSHYKSRDQVNPNRVGGILKQCRAEFFSREATSLSTPKGVAKASYASLGGTLGCRAQRIFVLCLLVQVPKGRP